MRKKIVIVGMALLLSGLGLFLAKPKQAHCVYCPEKPCMFASNCNGDECVCMKSGFDTWGKCTVILRDRSGDIFKR